MSIILKIYKRDIKKIITNTPLMIIIVGLLFIPALYAWINIMASWDPYGNTKGLLVAVVNNDKGAQFQNIKINVGNEVVNKLKNNESIGWTFVSQSEAESGVKYGKYYASITIPEDFSNSLLSVAANGEHKKAKLIYSVNEKIILLIFSLYVSIIFIMIIYTLVSVFGNVGKTLALVIMVLQVSSSGGTFPNEYWK